MDIIFFQAALICYLTASVGYVVFLFTSAPRAASLSSICCQIGLGLQVLSVIHRAVVYGFFPLGTYFDALSFLALLIVGLFIFLDRRLSAPVLGAVVAPMAAGLMLLGAAFSYQTRVPVAPILHSWWLPIHVVFALAGNAVFALMAVGGILYIFQEWLIKSKRIGRVHRLLPSLETLDKMNRHGLPLGFCLLTVGILSGALWANSAWGQYWGWDPKETWSLITWFTYAAMVHQRIVLGWRGKKAAWLAIVGFVLVMFTFVGASTLLGGHHSISGPGIGASRT